ncbi:acyltransferase family protein [Actinopolymorpha alba]|uniref:acyltransferase family protein n=1 Tax=Actinopolymorpha alba TaxID=533267 RepID=UPI00058EB544|nr:acyltransferase [Actinopolymorpha alba]
MQTGERGRIAALDGLRGLCALIVVITHTALLNPQLAAGYLPNPPASHGWAWWMIHTPLHLFWTGGDAVHVFFVLSGFVLTLPFVSATPSWRAYYPRRLVRLYVPVWGALVFALLVMAMIPRVHQTESRWVNVQAVHPTWASMLKDATLTRPTALDSPLWSLKWEVVFSLLLPAYLAVAKGLRRVGLFGLVVPAVLVLAGTVTGSAALLYLPMFAVGVLMATNLHSLRAMAARLDRWWPLVAVAGGGILVGRWWLPLGVADVLMSVVSAGVVVLLFLAWAPARTVGEHRVSQWVGRRSFSLYLIHVPIVLAAVRLPGWGPAVAFPASLLVAAVFYRLVERPALRFANHLGRRIGANRLTAPAAVPETVSRR